MTSKELYAHAENLFKAYSLLLDTDRGLAMQVYDAGILLYRQAGATERLESAEAGEQLYKWLNEQAEMEAQAKDHAEELRDLYPPF